MGKSHYAGIDIGSNAVRLLIKCLNEPGSAEPLSKVQLVRVPLRLGEDAFVDGRISKKKGKQLVSLMKAYRELMEIYEVSAFRACATSAMRDAENGAEHHAVGTAEGMVRNKGKATTIGIRGQIFLPFDFDLQSQMANAVF